jgi:dimeric dUTPase (all-alpha-NTP-PPase superfamily)
VNLDGLFELQRDLQRRIPPLGRTPEDIKDPAERNDFIAYTILSMTDELHEALGEIGWKPWATSRHLNRDAYLSELTDAFHFFLNACLAAGISGTELEEAYRKKRLINIARQQEGYDGVEGKCSVCHRDVKDLGVSCHEDPLHPGFYICSYESEK